MSTSNVIARLALTPERLGAHQAFLLDRPGELYIVDRGYVDLFAVLVDDLRNVLTRKPFVARIEPGRAFFGARVQPSPQGGKDLFAAFQAVPSRDAQLLRGPRDPLASRESFDLDAVSLIDDWVATAAEFIAACEPRPARDAVLLEADPGVPWSAGSVVSTYHLEVLWVWADRPLLFAGRPELPLPAGRMSPLTGRTWLTVPVEARISAVHTPGALLTGRLWPALDRYHDRILRAADLYREASEVRSRLREDEHARYDERVHGSMFRDLASLLGRVPPPPPVPESPSRVQAAAAAVAHSLGVELRPASPPSHADDPLEAVAAMVAPGGIRTRPIVLPPGWERGDGPSFVGFSIGDDPQPLAAVNTGRGGYQVLDPTSGERSPVTPALAETIAPRAVMLYPPLDPAVDNGLAALLQVLRGRGRDIATVLAMGAICGLIALLVPIATGHLLAEIIPRVDVPMWIAALAALGAGALATAAFSIVGTLGMLRLEARIDETMQAAVWSRLLSLPLPFFRDHLAGDLADRANGVTAIRQVLTGATSGAILSGVFSVFSFALIIYYSWELALWVGVTILVLVAVTWVLAVRQLRHHRAAFAAQGAIDGMVFQMLRGVAKLRQAHAEIHALKRWSELFSGQKRETLDARRWAAVQLAFNASFGPAAKLLLLAVIWYALLEDDPPTPFALSDFLSFHAAFGQLVIGATGVAAAWSAVVTVLPLFERVRPILEAETESATGGGVVLAEISGRIECENATFRYPSAPRDTLSGVSFHIRPGEYVAFVGSSGSGKSTLLRLMIGFERPTSGSVLLDGHDLLTLDLPAMRAHMGVVLQHSQLMPDTIFRNIAGEAPLGLPEAWEAVRAAGLAEEVEALPMGMQTVLSEGGAGLSGGQRQRLLIARALARKPRVLLLDEAASMLDNRAQATIRAALRGMKATRIVIAHRLNMAADADRIYVMQDGRIVESGRYDDLMQRGGAFTELARRQLV